MDDFTERFVKVETLHDILKFAEDWNFRKGKLGHTGLRTIPVKLISWENCTIEDMLKGIDIEVGITSYDGEAQLSIAPTGTFGGT